jgi:hypothetical protein
MVATRSPWRLATFRVVVPSLSWVADRPAKAWT